MKLSTIHYQYIGKLHVKLYQNWWSGFRNIRGQNTERHSFIIIRVISKIAGKKSGFSGMKKCLGIPKLNFKINENKA